MQQSKLPREIYIGGSAWGCIYFIGTYKAIYEKYNKDEISNATWYGDSSGAVLALAISLGIDPNILHQNYEKIALQVKDNGIFGKISIYHQCTIEMILHVASESDIERVLRQGKLGIGITTFLDKHEFITKWDNIKDLLECLHSSLHIPIYCCYNYDLQFNSPLLPKSDFCRIGTMTRNDKRSMHIDGSFSFTTSSLPNPNHTLILGIINEKNNDISCTYPFKMSDLLYPLVGQYGQDMFDQGYETMSAWIYQNKTPIKKDVNTNPRWVICSIIWTLRYLESIFVFIYSKIIT